MINTRRQPVFWRGLSAWSQPSLKPGYCFLPVMLSSGGGKKLKSFWMIFSRPTRIPFRP
jgi:hypothetical protein